MEKFRSCQEIRSHRPLSRLGFRFWQLTSHGKSLSLGCVMSPRSRARSQFPAILKRSRTTMSVARGKEGNPRDHESSRRWMPRNREKFEYTGPGMVTRNGQSARTKVALNNQRPSRFAWSSHSNNSSTLYLAYIQIHRGTVISCNLLSTEYILLFGVNFDSCFALLFFGFESTRRKFCITLNPSWLHGVRRTPGYAFANMPVNF